MIEGDADTQVKELLRLLHEEAKVHLMAAILTFAEHRDGKLRRPSLEAVSEARRLAEPLGGARSRASSSAPASPRLAARAGRATAPTASTCSTQPELAAYATEAYARARRAGDRRA